MKSTPADTFDEAYYERFYFDPKTRVVDREHTDRLGAFVCSYVRHLRVPVQRVLDIGCGIGLWRDQIARHFPHARYRGVEFSDYLCQRFGWERGSVLDYRAAQPYDLVICQGVLPYLDAHDLPKALRNLARLCKGALYLEAVTAEDWAADIVDDTLTDQRQFRHPAQAYRDGLSRHFMEMGGGLWLSQQADLPVFALERAAPSAGPSQTPAP
ncbi:MAG: class I SAM-dependent methyltransferase [Rhodoferax sp.]